LVDARQTFGKAPPVNAGKGVYVGKKVEKTEKAEKTEKSKKELAIKINKLHNKAASQLRKKAAKFRRFASIKTNGGQAEDRELILLAEKLEHEAGRIEVAKAKIKAEAGEAA
jgi:hypothetical protein